MMRKSYTYSSWDKYNKSHLSRKLNEKLHKELYNPLITLKLIIFQQKDEAIFKGTDFLNSKITYTGQLQVIKFFPKLLSQFFYRKDLIKSDEN